MSNQDSALKELLECCGKLTECFENRDFIEGLEWTDKLSEAYTEYMKSQQD